MVRFYTKEELKAEGFSFLKADINGNMLVDVWAHERHLFSMRFIPPKRYGKELTKRDHQWINGYYELSCPKED